MPTKALTIHLDCIQFFLETKFSRISLKCHIITENSIFTRVPTIFYGGEFIFYFHFGWFWLWTQLSGLRNFIFWIAWRLLGFLKHFFETSQFSNSIHPQSLFFINMFSNITVTHICACKVAMMLWSVRVRDPITRTSRPSLELKRSDWRPGTQPVDLDTTQQKLKPY